MELGITELLVAIIAVISYTAFNRPMLIAAYKHWPYAEARQRQWYRMLSAGFLHSGWLHLLINIFVLWMFGSYVEHQFINLFGTTMGPVNYLLLFLLTVVAANIPSYYAYKDIVGFSAIGASGAVSGIVFVFILFNPWQMLYLYGILPIPGIIAGLLYLYYSSWASKHGRDNIDHSAHFYGAIFGVLFTIVIQPRIFWEFLQRLVSDFPL